MKKSVKRILIAIVVLIVAFAVYKFGFSQTLELLKPTYPLKDNAQLTTAYEGVLYDATDAAAQWTIASTGVDSSSLISNTYLFSSAIMSYRFNASDSISCRIVALVSWNNSNWFPMDSVTTVSDSTYTYKSFTLPKALYTKVIVRGLTANKKAATGTKMNARILFVE